MFILSSGEYLPARVVDNEYFAQKLGKPQEWFIERTGILRRRRAALEENVHTLAFRAVAALMAGGASLSGVDLIIAASYTPLDTIGTMAHAIQREFVLKGARAIYLSTACSSFMDALEAASLYLAAGKARQALIVAAEHNSAYSRDEDPQSGHLWGDGAAAVLLGTEDPGGGLEVVEVETCGLGDLGCGPEAIALRHPAGIRMLNGREVFAQACEHMAAAVRGLLQRNALSIADVNLLVPHQANGRIVTHLRKDLGIATERVAVTIDELGNTGCASVPITLHRFAGEVLPGEHIVLVSFGGGYSVAVALLRRSAARAGAAPRHDVSMSRYPE